MSAFVFVFKKMSIDISLTEKSLSPNIAPQANKVEQFKEKLMCAKLSNFAFILVLILRIPHIDLAEITNKIKMLTNRT